MCARRVCFSTPCSGGWCAEAHPTRTKTVKASVCNVREKKTVRGEIMTRTGSSIGRERLSSKERVGGSTPSRCMGAKTRRRTDSSTAEPPTFNRRDASSSLARCSGFRWSTNGSVAQRQEAAASEAVCCRFESCLDHLASNRWFLLIAEGLVRSIGNGLR